VGKNTILSRKGAKGVLRERRRICQSVHGKLTKGQTREGTPDGLKESPGRLGLKRIKKAFSTSRVKGLAYITHTRRFTRRQRTAGNGERATNKKGTAIKEMKGQSRLQANRRRPLLE